MMLREVRGFCRLPAYVPEARIAPEIARVAAMSAGDEAVLAASSNNSNTVTTLDTPLADPDPEGLRQKFNELLLALRR